jgi:hypothetical protein
LKFNTAIAWPWFIVIGTLLTTGISLLGKTPDDVRAAFKKAADGYDEADAAAAAAAAAP